MTEEEIRQKHLNTYCTYNIDINYFRKIDSHAKAQVLGMMYADGCNRNSGHISISLMIDDLEYLEFIKKELKSDRPIYIEEPKKNSKSSNKMVKLCITNIFISNDLIKLGCWPRKTYNLNFPTKEQVPEEFINSFILGFFEGDGTIFKSAYNCKYKEKSYSYPCWNFGFVGTKNMLENIQIILNKMCDFPINKLLLDKRVSYDFYSLMYNASITDKNNKIERLHSYLYKDAIFVMKRKKESFEKILKLKQNYNSRKAPHNSIFSIEEYNRRYKILKENIDLSLVEVAKLIGIKDYTTISDMYKKWNIFRPGLKYSKNE